MLNKKENIITFSKNFQTKTNKDTVTNDFYKVKFWQKNAKRIEKFFSKKYESINDNSNESINENENEKEIKNDNDNNISHKFSFKNLSINLLEEKSQSNKNLPNDNNNNNNNNKEIVEESKNTISINKIRTEGNNNINENFLINTNKAFNLENIKINNEIPTITMNNLKIYNIKKPNLNNNNNINTINESSLPSITINTINNTITDNNNNVNKSELILFSRNNNKHKIKNISNSNISTNTNINTNKLKKSLFNSTYKSYNHNSQKKFFESSIKYKRNLSKQVKELNTHTIKCNLKLCKLIDGNYIEKINKKKGDFDINKDLSDNKINNETKNNKSFLNYYEIEKLKLKNKNNKIN